MKRMLLYISVAALLSSCAAHVISRDVREGAVKDVSFRVAKENIETYKGMKFIWGGFIAATRFTEEGAFLEVVQNPVDDYGDIVDTDVSQGRFLAFTEKDLDPLIYEKGRLVTVAGELTGSKTVKRKNRDYTYPILTLEEIHLWKEQDYVYYPYDYWYGPYWGYPYYDFPYYFPHRFSY